MTDRQRAHRRKKKIRRKRILFAVEIIVLLLLSLVLVVAVWAARKFSLINHQELDEDRLLTSDKVNSGSVAAGDADGDQQNPVSSLTGVDVIALVGLDTRDELEGQNSDTMIIACINHNDKTIKLASLYRDTYLNVGDSYYGEPDYYTKANAAYNFGGPEQMLSMINLNFDLNITEFMTVEFKALADTIELLGGLDIDMTREEVIHLNNYNVETSSACEMEYAELELPSADEFDGAMTRTFHLNGSQAVSYARIRKTAGNDFRRTARQRLVLEKIMEKAKSADLGTLDAVLNTVLHQITTNMDNNKIVSMIQPLLSYTITDQTGFPFAHMEDDGSLTGEDCVLPVTLEYNAIHLHQFFFPDAAYTPSATVLEYSEQIIAECGYGEESVEMALGIDDGGEIPQWTQELQDQADAEAYASGYEGEY